MIEEFLNDAQEIQQAEKERGADYAAQVSVNKLNKNQNVNNHQAELVFNDDDEMVERSPSRWEEDLELET